MVFFCGRRLLNDMKKQLNLHVIYNVKLKAFKSMNKRLIEKILDRIPSHIKPINYLMDNLDIGRESAYRRLRGDIPFALEEVVRLSRILEFSIDEALFEKKANRIYIDAPAEYSDPSKSFFEMLRKYCSTLSQVSAYENTEIHAAQNRLPLSMIIRNEHLFRFFYYYRYISVHHDNAQKECFFSQTVIPEEIMSYRNEFIKQMPNIHRYCYIVNSRSFFLSVCREIQFCFSRHLITANEVSLLQNALFDLLGYIKKIVVKGVDDCCNNILFYLSFPEVGANNTSISFGENMVSQFWIYYNHFIEIRNAEVCLMHRNLFETMKKYSILITRSNEIFQTKFIDQQQQHIDNITQEFLYV
jgi:hypothetical protein